MACSPPRAAGTVSQVRGRRVKGGPGRKGAAWAAGGARKVGSTSAGPKGNPRREERSLSKLGEWGRVMGNEPGAACTACPDVGRGGGKGRSDWEKRGTAFQPSRKGAESGEDRGKGLGERPRGVGIIEELPTRDLTVPQEKGTVGQHAGSKVVVDRGGQAQEKDPKVPVSKKWPTILQWSGSEEEEGSVTGKDEWQEDENPSTSFAIEVPKTRRAECGSGTLAGREGGARSGLSDSISRSAERMAQGCGRFRWAVLWDVETEQEVWRAEGSEGSSVEEVDLVEGSNEQEWWECGKGGGSLMMRFSRDRLESSCRCRLLDGGEMDLGWRNGQLRRDPRSYLQVRGEQA
ncbi:hypothetical protein NDU88_002741 [Pleurodeles waltl]|uniref:Uncharacterized protein n=1 Tax=Pleurodeles waltl TaxID=8319 RepID=A0AAV7MTN7_PLEWA|nr:hypothetical protein NDU88_002741 [Pleurodeles waltl]